VERERHCYRPVDERFLSEPQARAVEDEALRQAKLELLNGKHRTWEHP